MNIQIRVKGLSPILGLLALILLWASPVQADKARVTNDNSGVEYADLQAAIDLANSGDTLSLKGHFYGSFVIDKSLTLKGSRYAILDGSNGVRVLEINTPDITVFLENLKIQNGFATVGAGILNIATLSLKNVSVVNNTSVGSQGGAGIANFQVSPLDATVGVGILTITNSTISRNSALNGGPGGGVRTQGGTFVLENSEVEDNTSTCAGGGLALIASVNTISDTEIEGNSSTAVPRQIECGGFGGGILTLDLAFTTLNNVEVEKNTAVSGGGIAQIDSTLVINHSKIHKNTAFQVGGGIFDLGDGSTTLNDSKVTDNQATSGGGIFNVTGAILQLNHTEVEENTPNDIVEASLI